MADLLPIPDEAETRARWRGFAWTLENAAQANTTAVLSAIDVVFGECDR